MKKIIIYLFVAGAMFAQEADFLFQQGNDLYKAEKYTEAIEQYKAVLEQGYESPELYYNLGNAYFKEQEIGMAILCFERAKKMSPHDPDIEYNLKLAQLRVVDKIPVPPPFFLLKIWRTIKNALTLKQLGIVALGLWIILSIILITRMIFRQPAALYFSRMFLVPVLSLFLMFAFLFGVRLNEENTIEDAIVIVDKVEVKSSPVASSTQVFALHEGAKVAVTDESGEFSRIKLADGKVGWIQSNTVIKI